MMQDFTDSNAGEIASHHDEQERAIREQTMTDLITALQTGPGSRELSDQVLMALGWTKIKVDGKLTGEWTSPDGYYGYPDRMPLPDPTQSIDDACTCGGVSDMNDSQRSLVLKTAIDMFCDALDDGATAKDGARFFCIAIMRAKESE